MTNFVNNDIELFNPIKANMPRFIEAHVRVFGEKYREQITNSLNTALFLFPVVDEDFLQTQLNSQIEKEKSLHTNHSEIKKHLNKYQLILDLIKKNKVNQQTVSKRYIQIKNSFFKKTLNNALQRNGLKTLTINNDTLFYTYNNILEFGLTNLQKRQNFIIDKDKDKICKFFQALGFKEHKTFSDYLNDKKIKELLFNKNIISEYDSLNAKLNKQLTSENVFILNAIKQLQKLNSPHHDHLAQVLIDYMTTESETTAFVRHMFNVDIGYSHVCFFSNNPLNDTTTLIHEMGHIIDCSCIKLPNNKYLTKSGYQITIHKNLNHKLFSFSKNYLNSTSCKKDDYKMFNEIITEYLAQKVTKGFQSLGSNFNIGNKPQNAFTLYTLGFNLFGEFIENHINKIIEFKMEADIKKMVEYFGAKNLAKLMTISNKYVKIRKDLLPLNSNKKIELDNSIYLKYKKIVDEIDKSIQQKNNKVLNNSNDFNDKSL